MTTIKIKTSGAESRILVEAKLSSLTGLIPENTIVITDETVNSLYGDAWNGYRTIVTGMGEKINPGGPGINLQAIARFWC